MPKEHFGFRADGEVANMLKNLEQRELETAEKQKTDPKSRSDIINEAIRNYYLVKMTDENYTPFMRMMEKVLGEVFRENMKPLVDCINAGRYDIRESLEYQRLQCKAMNLDLAEGGIEALLYSVMPWDIAIPQKIARDMQVKKYGLTIEK